MSAVEEIPRRGGGVEGLDWLKIRVQTAAWHGLLHGFRI
jgi:hypothetical protein